MTVDKSVIGFLTLKDILRIEPSLFEIAHSHKIFEIKEEQEKLKRRASSRTASGWVEGACEECGNSDLLYREDGRLICEDCIDKI